MNLHQCTVLDQPTVDNGGVSRGRSAAQLLAVFTSTAQLIGQKIISINQH